ncbi:MAG TPA: ATP-binding cassette domain-containing protein [Solirubrobacteraceae bacterium]|nr:ATP-binding cassette domain-containing protein [Solirubrobacteraceae bacterium]
MTKHRSSRRAGGPAPAVEVEGLVKRFDHTTALDGLDLRVPAGTVCAILGPNGAGKTTTIRILATLLRPEEGTARVLGHDVVREADAVRRSISLTGQFAAVDEDLTGAENLTVLGRLLGLSRRSARNRAAELLAAFDLDESAHRPVRTYSGGMRRRVDLAASMIITPELLFLDEPTTGLDPHSRSRIWNVVRAVVARGTTVLLTTQYLDEADQLADRIAVIDHGKLIAAGTTHSLKASVGASRLEVRVEDPDERARAADLIAATLSVPVRLGADPAALAAGVADVDRVADALQALLRAQIRLASFAVGQPRLDEVFLALTGHPVEDPTEKEKVA